MLRTLTTISFILGSLPFSAMANKLPRPLGHNYAVITEDSDQRIQNRKINDRRILLLKQLYNIHKMRRSESMTSSQNWDLYQEMNQLRPPYAFDTGNLGKTEEAIVKIAKLLEKRLISEPSSDDVAAQLSFLRDRFLNDKKLPDLRLWTREKSRLPETFVRQQLVLPPELSASSPASEAASAAAAASAPSAASAPAATPKAASAAQ